MHQVAKASISAADATLSLFTAAAVGDRAAVVRWLAAGADATAKNDYGKYPFQVAIDAEHDVLTAILLKAAGGIDARDKQGWTPLNWAILSGDWQLVQEFIRAGADTTVGRQDAWEVAEMMESEAQLIEIIIAEKGLDAKVGNREEPLMMHAARVGRTELVRKLLDAGADPNAANRWAATALVPAMNGGHTEIVAMLIEGGADPNTTWQAWSVLAWAAYNGHAEIVKLLIAKGADLNARNYRGDTALDIAKNKEIAAMLRTAMQAKNAKR